MNTLTVFFDEPWWVGVIEHDDAGALTVFRHVFGAEPSAPEVLAFVLGEYAALVSRPAIIHASEPATLRHINPKRLAREVARDSAERGVSRRSTEALRLELEQRKHERVVYSREQRLAAEEEKRAKARQKALARRRGH